MKRTVPATRSIKAIVIAAALLTPLLGHNSDLLAVAPTLVQSVSTSNTRGYAVNSYTVRLPNATLSGNSVIVAVQQGSGTGALSVSDDKGNTYNLAKINDNLSQIVSIYYATNVLAGAQKITLTFAGAGAKCVAAVPTEF